MSCGVGHRHGSDPKLLWPWRRPGATDPVQPLAWEPPYATGVALKRSKKKKESDIATSRGVSHICDSDLAMLWLWYRPAPAAVIWPIAWELPCATGVALKNLRIIPCVGASLCRRLKIQCGHCCSAGLIPDPRNFYILQVWPKKINSFYSAVNLLPYISIRIQTDGDKCGGVPVQLQLKEKKKKGYCECCLQKYEDLDSVNVIFLFIYLFFFFLVFLPFLGLLPRHMEVPRLGV